MTDPNGPAAGDPNGPGPAPYAPAPGFTPAWGPPPAPPGGGWNQSPGAAMPSARRRPALIGAGLMVGLLVVALVVGVVVHYGHDVVARRPGSATQSLDRVVKDTAALPLLHWTGPWTPGPSGTQVTIDLRITGAGDGFGTATRGNDSAQVILLGGQLLLLKADAAYWSQDAIAFGATPQTLAGRWVLQGEDPTVGPLKALAPTGFVDPGGMYFSKHASLTRPPPGVPAGAVGIDDDYAGDVRQATLWVTRSDRPTIAGLSTGPNWPDFSVTSASLTAQSGTAADAQALDRTLSAQLADVPVDVLMGGISNYYAKPSGGASFDCTPTSCTITSQITQKAELDAAALKLIGEPPTDRVRYTVPMTLSGTPAHEGFPEELGTCNAVVTLPVDVTDGTARCTIHGRRLRSVGKDRGSGHSITNLTAEVEDPTPEPFTPLDVAGERERLNAAGGRPAPSATAIAGG